MERKQFNSSKFLWRRTSTMASGHDYGQVQANGYWSIIRLASKLTDYALEHNTPKCILIFVNEASTERQTRAQQSCGSFLFIFHLKYNSKCSDNLIILLQLLTDKSRS